MKEIFYFFNIIKSSKSGMCFTLATFQVLSNHMQPEATVLESRALKDDSEMIDDKSE